MKTINPIGIFDSGIGGLTIAHEVNKILPNEKIIYFGDTQHLPYGEKSPKKIIYYCEKIIDFLLKKNCKCVIIACNSASSIAFQKLLKKINGECILCNVIDPVIQYVKHEESIKKIGIIGTKATIKSNIYQATIKTLRKDINVYSLATPLLASLIEENNNTVYQKEIVEMYLTHENLNDIDSLILGCTHYPLIEPTIRSFYGPDFKIMSAINHIGRFVKKALHNANVLNKSTLKPKHEFYVSDYTQHFQEKTNLFFPKHIILEEQDIF